MQKIIVEKVSENMAEATVGQWYVDEGDKVSRGDDIVELITEKATFQIQADQDGIVLLKAASSKSVLPVGFTVCMIGSREEGDIKSIKEKNRTLLQKDSIDIEIDTSGNSKKPATGSSSRIKATPAARREAAKNDIGLRDIKTFLDKQGVISKTDVEEFLNKREE